VLSHATVRDEFPQAHFQRVAIGPGDLCKLRDRLALLRPQRVENLERQLRQVGVAGVGDPFTLQSCGKAVLLLLEAAQEKTDPRLPIRRFARERRLRAATHWPRPSARGLFHSGSKTASTHPTDSAAFRRPLLKEKAPARGGGR
jgi:hypothetical protein